MYYYHMQYEEKGTIHAFKKDNCFEKLCNSDAYPKNRRCESSPRGNELLFCGISYRKMSSITKDAGASLIKKYSN